MVQGKKLLVGSLFAAASFLSLESTSLAGYTEVGDAGQTLATAAQAGATTSFAGTLSSANDADLYFFTITTAGSYTFSTVGNTVDPTYGTLDTALFLFSSTGTALLTDDDANGSNVESSLTANLAAGSYYLGISLSGNEPINSNGQLLFAGYPAGDTTATRGPASGVTPTTEANFDGASQYTNGGRYGVNMAPPALVPEPSTWAALALGGIASGFTFLRRRSA